MSGWGHMPSRRQAAVGAALDEAAIAADGRDALVQLELLVRAISRRRLWAEIAWEPERAEAEALRDVARVRRAIEAAEKRDRRAGPLGEGGGDG